MPGPLSELMQCRPSPPAHPSLAAGDVHVWRASLEPPAALVNRIGLHLSAAERAKADRFHFEKDRRHFTVARGFLRVLLGRYLAMAPAALRFIYTEYGKPKLAPDFEVTARQLKFNLAHSGGLALYAFTSVEEVGIDLEQMREGFSGDDIARRFFSPAEVACLNQLPAALRHEAFFNCWTRKEAFIKAKGKGLSLRLDQFDVTLNPDEPAALLATRWDESEAARWSLRAIDPGPGFVGALAIEAHGCRFSYWQLAGDLAEDPAKDEQPVVE